MEKLNQEAKDIKLVADFHVSVRFERIKSQVSIYQKFSIKFLLIFSGMYHKWLKSSLLERNLAYELILSLRW